MLGSITEGTAEETRAGSEENISTTEEADPHTKEAAGNLQGGADKS